MNKMCDLLHHNSLDDDEKMLLYDLLFSNKYVDFDINQFSDDIKDLIEANYEVIFYNSLLLYYIKNYSQFKCSQINNIVFSDLMSMCDNITSTKNSFLWAVQYNNRRIIIKLLQNYDICIDTVNDVFLSYVEKKNLNMVADILKYSENIYSINDALLICIYSDYKNMISIILKHGIDIISKNFALMHSVFSNNIFYVKLLLNYGADITSINNDDGNTLLMNAIEFENNIEIDIIIYILEYCIIKNIHILGYINIKNNEGDNALIYAVLCDKIDIVNILLLYGANINDKNDNDISPLIYACAFHNYDIVELLLNNGAYDIEKARWVSINKVEEYMHIEVKNTYTKIINLLKEKSFTIIISVMNYEKIFINYAELQDFYDYY